MKIFYGILSVLLLAIAIANAQQKRDTIHHAATQKKPKMKTELGLNKQQDASVKASKKEYKQKADKLKADTTLSKAQKKEQKKKLKEEKNKKVDAVLTPVQKEKEKVLKKEKKEAKKGKE